MQFHNWYFRSLIPLHRKEGDGAGIVLGLVMGRVSYLPQALWLYSLRIYLLFWKLEILWKTGIMPE